MNSSLDTLFAPHTVGSLTLPTRLVMAPMTRERSPSGIPGGDVAAYYQRRACNGVGLIITEGAAINHPSAVNSLKIPRFYGEDALAGWKKLANAVHEAGARIVPQLWHQGMERQPGGEQPFPEAPSMGPSGIGGKEFRQTSQPMSKNDIDVIVSAFAQAANEAYRLGFDGIELHGAHGYLLDQFFWAKTNCRTDAYGGNITARTQFACEVIDACRKRIPKDFPLILRISQWKVVDFAARLATTPQELEQLLLPLVEAGVDIFHCSTRRFWEPEFPGSPLNLAGWTKKITGKPVITVGSIGHDIDLLREYLQGKKTGASTLEILLGMIDRNEVDLAAIGRQVLADFEWTTKVRQRRGHELRPVPPNASQIFY